MRPMHDRYYEGKPISGNVSSARNGLKEMQNKNCGTSKLAKPLYAGAPIASAAFACMHAMGPNLLPDGRV